ncbi:hypothetical protein BUALT_Bualt14G0003500 [Buddleja alternifolia]|uniref:Cytochrome P450 n=1 Tax=Buddleja alternifolia TaxID=168488 RepID=A0AAV6WGP6_9LAMI|nr:hypothetical protein BUALT_Bualt14G0003500 [Buddleja alternifolia]
MIMNTLLVDSSLIAVSILLLIVSMLWWIWKSSTKMPPGPRGLPIVGYLPFLREDLHNQFIELAHKYGPIYKFWIGNKLCVVISSPSLIKQVVRDHDTIFSNRDLSVATRIATLDANDIALSPYGPGWRDSRKLFVHQLMNNSSLDASYNLRKDQVMKAIKHVYSKIGTGVDICELVYEIVVSLMMSMAWGSTVQGEARDKIGSGFLPLLASVLEGMGKPNISDYFPILSMFDIQGVGKEMKSLMQRVECVIGDIIDEGMKTGLNSDHKGDGFTDFVQMIVGLKEKDPVKISSLTRTQVVGMFINIITSGNDTSSTIIWVMSELLNNPEVMEMARKELNEVVGLNNTVEELHIPKLVYLDAVIKESMRLHPIAPFLIPRTPSKSCTVGGYTIPKNSGIFLNVFSVQRDPIAFDNPLEFKPERFFNNSSSSAGKLDFRGNNFNYLPFGSGRRICAGIPLAERLLRYILASLLHSFDWQLPEGENLDMSDKLSTTLTRSTPLYAIPVPRLSDSNL